MHEQCRRRHKQYSALQSRKRRNYALAKVSTLFL